jgi:hypothetical protein
MPDAVTWLPEGLPSLFSNHESYIPGSWAVQTAVLAAVATVPDEMALVAGHPEVVVCGSSSRVSPGIK